MVSGSSIARFMSAEALLKSSESMAKLYLNLKPHIKSIVLFSILP